MPLPDHTRNHIIDYCDKHIETDEMIENYFSFIKKKDLKKTIINEYKSARYIYKLGEALFVDGEKLCSHAKFQIVQYASIYEAIINYLLWEKFSNCNETKKIEVNINLKEMQKFNNKVIFNNDKTDLYFCVKINKKLKPQNIRFDDKVNAAVAIGFIDEQIGEEIKTFYKLRNGVHLDAASNNNIEYELEQAKLSYRRMLPFTTGISYFLSKGVLPQNARPKTHSFIAE